MRKTFQRWLVRNPMSFIGLVVVLIWVLGAVLANWIAPYDPLVQNVANRLQAPNAEHPWGTDQLGRDIYSRVLYGGRISLPAGLIAVIFATALGSMIGAIAGYAGGLWDELIMRLTEIFMAFPTIILAMAISAALGPSIINAMIALTVVSWPSYARITRGLVIGEKVQEYVTASRAVGASHLRILLRSILPNCLSAIIVVATLDFGNAVLLFAGLSFLGLGPEPASPEWGRMISTGIDFFDQWWMSVFPGLAMFSVVMALNFIGDGIRDIADPRTAKK
jgi:ABC-type dipeptide/oligopeptide/nickel transport system permease subunit